MDRFLRDLGERVKRARQDRGLSQSDLAEILGVSVDELMQVKREAETPKKGSAEIVETVLKALTLAMGVAVAVLSIMDAIDTKSAIIMLGIGLACVGINMMRK